MSLFKYPSQTIGPSFFLHDGSAFLGDIRLKINHMLAKKALSREHLTQ
jgi:hypothetical protein